MFSSQKFKQHTILPTSFNNQHLQEDDDDDLDSTGISDEVKGRDLERWTNVGQGREEADVAWYFGSYDGSMDTDESGRVGVCRPVCSMRFVGSGDKFILKV